jgi:hypothetical protein
MKRLTTIPITALTRGHGRITRRGGDDWFPMSYNPNTGYIYVCGVEQAQLFEGGKTAVFKAGKQFYGSTAAPQGVPAGTFTAIDASTNKIA